MKKTYYEILEIPQNATQEEVKKAFRTLAKKYHPDNNANNQAESSLRMLEITEAYEVLSNLEKRKQYDNELKCKGIFHSTDYNANNKSTIKPGFSVRRESNYSSYNSYRESKEENESDLEDYLKVFLKKYREYLNDIKKKEDLDFISNNYKENNLYNFYKENNLYNFDNIKIIKEEKKLIKRK